MCTFGLLEGTAASVAELIGGPDRCLTLDVGGPEIGEGSRIPDWNRPLVVSRNREI